MFFIRADRQWGEIEQELGHLYNGQIIAPVDWVLEIINDIASQAFLINQNNKFISERWQILNLYILLYRNYKSIITPLMVCSHKDIEPSLIIREIFLFWTIISQRYITLSLYHSTL